MHVRNLALALAAGALLASASASAAEDAEARTVAVVWKDLDLATEEGSQELERRLDRAAREVCSVDETLTGTRIRRSDTLRCYRETKSRMTKSLAALVERESREG